MHSDLFAAYRCGDAAFGINVTAYLYITEFLFV